MPSWKKVITSGSDASFNSIFSSGPITGSDIQISDWGSVSASLSTLTSDVANIDSNVTLQDATDNGSTTTNNITIDSTGDARLVLDRAANSNDSEIEFKTNGTTNWTIGTGQVGSDNEFTIKGGSTNYVRINDSGQADFLSAVTSSDITIDDWGSVSASLSTLTSDVANIDSNVTLQDATDNGSSTTNVITFPNFVLNTPTNNNAGSDKILVLDGSNRSKIRTRDQLRDDIGALQASRTPQIVVTAAEVLDEALTGVYIPFSGINIFPETNTTAYSRFHAPYDGYIKEIIVHPHEAATSGTCTITPAIDGTGTTSVQETISATAGTPTTFTFGVVGYSFSDGDDIVLEFDRESNTRSKGFSFTIVFIMDTTS